MLHIKSLDCTENFAQFSNECAKTSYNAFLVFIMYSNKGLPKSLEALYSQYLHGGASRPEETPLGESSAGIPPEEPQPVPPKAGDTSVFTAMLYTEYQPLTGISDLRVTIPLDIKMKKIAIKAFMYYIIAWVGMSILAQSDLSGSPIQFFT